MIIIGRIVPMQHRYVFGFLGPSCTGNIRKTWNAHLQAKNIDGFFDFYRTKTVKDLETRLSEMFLLQRRGYILHPSLQSEAVRLMDRLDDSAQKEGKVDTVLNDRGVLVGGVIGDEVDERLKFWLRKGDRE
jgi:shikimate 5-dehydrogenase